VAVIRTSDDARDLLTAFANAHGVTVSALLEAIARRLPPDGGALSPDHVEIVSEARAIDVERRSRG
jgi:hypothetical protein